MVNGGPVGPLGGDHRGIGPTGGGRGGAGVGGAGGEPLSVFHQETNQLL